MKLYKIYRKKLNFESGIYISMIVCAENEAEALKIHPAMEIHKKFDEEPNNLCWENTTTWVKDIKHLSIEYIGKSEKNLKKGVICASWL